MDNPFDLLMLRLESIEQLILNQANIRTEPVVMATVVDEPSMNVDDAAAYLGCAKSTLLKYHRNKVIPSFKAGRKIYFKKSEIDAALATSQKLPGKNSNKTFNTVHGR